MKIHDKIDRRKIKQRTYYWVEAVLSCGEKVRVGPLSHIDWLLRRLLRARFERATITLYQIRPGYSIKLCNVAHAKTLRTFATTRAALADYVKSRNMHIPATTAVRTRKGVNCAHCNEIFTPLRKSRKYCSDTCRAKAYQLRRAVKDKQYNSTPGTDVFDFRACLKCGKRFARRTINHKYCSQRCCNSSHGLSKLPVPLLPLRKRDEPYILHGAWARQALHAAEQDRKRQALEDQEPSHL